MKTKLYLTLILFSLLVSNMVLAQQKEIIGKVITFNTYPVNKAKIEVRGNKQAVYSKADGTFRFQPGKKNKITVSALGFAKRNLIVENVKDTLVINLIFNGNLKKLKEKANYEHVPLSVLTQASENMKHKNIIEVHYTNMVEMLDQTLPNVTVEGDLVTINKVQNLLTDFSRIGNADGNVMKEGSTLKEQMDQTHTDPIFVVDGFETKFDQVKDIDPDDVKSIRVLDVHESANQYGLRGFYGVIIIETIHQIK